MTNINQRRDTSTNWTSVNPVLPLGQLGWETDTRMSKLGDGVTAWNDLLYTVSDVVVTADDVGLGDVDNTSDADKPLSSAAVAALGLKAPIASPVFTGSPTAPTPLTSDNSTRVATTAYVKAQTAAYAPIDSPALTGVPTAPTPASSDDSNTVATTAYVQDNLLGVVPVGAVIDYAGLAGAIPANYLVADGSTFSATAFPVLAARYGDMYGAHAGDNYYLPDFRNRQAVGVSGTKAVGATGGAESRSLAVANLPNHQHTFNRQQAAYDGGGTPTNVALGEGAAAATGATVGTTGATGTALNTMDPWLSVYKIIRAA